MISNKYINTIIITILVIAITFTTFLVLMPEGTFNPTITQPEYIDKAFDKDKITSINIEITDEDWQTILDNPTAEEYVPANITINGENFTNVGIRAKGNSSLSSIARDNTTDRYSFKIKFDEYVKGQTYYGLDKLVLNNNYSDTTNMKEYLSYDLLTEMGIATPAFAYSQVKMNGKYFGLYLAVEVVEESFLERNFGTSEGNLYKPEGTNLAGGNMPNAIDNKNENSSDGTTGDSANTNVGQVPQVNSESLKIPSGNGQPPEDNAGMPQMPGGNYQIPQLSSGNEKIPANNNTITEEKQFGNFGGMSIGSKGGSNLVYVDEDLSNYSTLLDSAVFKTTDDNDKQKVVDMIKNLNEGTNLEKYLNVDEIIRYFAVNTFLVNLDSYASNMKHNYYLYEKDGIFEILPWDYNMSFAGFQSGDSSSAINFPIDSPVTDTVGNSPLIEKLLEVSEYKELYHKYLEELVDYVNNGTFESTINKVDTLISDYVKDDPTAFFTYDEYKASLPELITFGTDRVKSITAQLDGSQPSTTYGNIVTTLNLNALGSMGGDDGKDNFSGNGDKPIGNSPMSNVNDNMPDKNVMIQAMQIVQGSNGEFTEDVINKLKYLGLDDNSIEMLKTGPGGQINNGNKPSTDNTNSQIPPKENLNDDTKAKDDSDVNSVWQISVYLFSIIVLIISIVYVSKFKNKKYIS